MYSGILEARVEHDGTSVVYVKHDIGFAIDIPRSQTQIHLTKGTAIEPTQVFHQQRFVDRITRVNAGLAGQATGVEKAGTFNNDLPDASFHYNHLYNAIGDVLLRNANVDNRLIILPIEYNDLASQLVEIEQADRLPKESRGNM